jgi:phage shock protein A
MADLFKKLNTLIRASINDLGSPPTAKDDRPRLTQQLDRDLRTLYSRVDDTERFQHELQSRSASLQQELSRLDGEIDEALRRGQAEHARYLQEQANRARQRLTMTESDLREHQRASAELAWQVHQLETALEETRQQLRQRVQGGAPAPRASESLDELGEQLRSAREKLTGPAPGAGKVDAPRAPEKDDDLETRIQRLSKR